MRKKRVYFVGPTKPFHTTSKAVANAHARRTGGFVIKLGAAASEKARKKWGL